MAKFKIKIKGTQSAKIVEGATIVVQDNTLMVKDVGNNILAVFPLENLSYAHELDALKS